jgi:hypothetical protein
MATEIRGYPKSQGVLERDTAGLQNQSINVMHANKAKHKAIFYRNNQNPPTGHCALNKQMPQFRALIQGLLQSPE